MDSLKVDNEKHQIQISIRELIYPDTRSQMGGPSLPFYLRTSKGTQIHSNYQQTSKLEKKHTKTSVKSEYRVKIKRKVKDWIFVIGGRTDLVQITGNTISVEEIKSVNHLPSFSLDSDNALLYKLQLLFYAQYFKNTYPDKKIECKLVIIDVFTEDQEDYIIPFNSVLPELDEKCSDLLQSIHENSKNSTKRKKRVDSIVFPFDRMRPHQKEIIQTVHSILDKKQDLMLLAPSGIGKTVGTLYPALQYTIGKGKRLFVVTSKTTQQKMYEETLRLFVRKKGKLNAIILTAKEKMCLNTTYTCDPEYCPYADSYPEDYESEIKSMLKTKVLTSRYIRKKAKAHKICPFELALDCSLYCDVIVGDFNYVFSPVIKLQRFFKGKYKDSICIIDEAHNLPDRARDYYSPEISKELISECIGFIQSQSVKPKLRNKVIHKLKELDSFIDNVIAALNNPGLRVASVTISKTVCEKILDGLEKLVVAYVGTFYQQLDLEPMAGDPFVIFVKQVHFFYQILEQSHLDEFEQLAYPKDGKIKILCKSASTFLKKQMKGFHSVIAQSATLHPVGYYREMLGLPEDSEILKYTSPFPQENRLYMDFPFVSTRYKERDSTYHDIAKLIQDAIQLETGNYLVFFPSFQYLHNVLKELNKLSIPNQILTQKRRMTERARKQTLEKLKSGITPYLLLGVHGGIFSEGVDYLGKMAIGAFIISPGLPQYCYEQELMKNYFQKQYMRGFEFAYRNPGLTRVIQAAGRIFRSETDKGFIILIGQRFHTDYYRSVLPKDWDIETPQNYPLRIEKFWRN